MESDKEEFEMFKNLLLDDSLVGVMREFPNTHLVSAGLDPLKLGCEKLEAKLRLAGVHVEHSSYPQKDHGFFCLDVDNAMDAIENASKSLGESLKMMN